VPLAKDKRKNGALLRRTEFRIPARALRCSTELFRVSAAPLTKEGEGKRTFFPVPLQCFETMGGGWGSNRKRGYE